MSQDTQYNTTDSRDGQTYTITKINNRIWMTKNLNLAGGTTLTSAEYNTLISSFSTGATLTSSPFLAVYTGRYYDSAFTGGGSNGYYWSSTVSNSSNAYYLYFSSSNADVYGNAKRSGFSVRCVKS